ncbi:MAG: HAMP domain-containing protein [Saprospiraceae bacterium]|nr:HAMP domain-containing protein [Saprospiraceae bacterium]
MLFLIGIGLVGFVLLQYSSKEILSSSEKKLNHTAELINTKFSDYVESLKQDITFVAQSPLLQKYLETKKESDRKLLSEEYQSLISSKPDLFQIRFIGLKDTGKEMVRVERRGPKVIIVPDDQLQEKGKRDYFVETVSLPADSMFISPIDLNKEYGEISAPFVPTLRLALPVYQGATLIGIIVINTDLSLIFNSFNQILEPPFELRMVNNTGYYLIHEDHLKTFGFEFGNPPGFRKEFGVWPEDLDNFNERVFSKDGVLYAIESLSFPRKDYELFVMVLAREEILLESYYVYRKNSFLIIIGLGLVFMFISFFYLSGQSKELKEITDEMRALPKTLQASNLPIKRKDEIGALANSFNEMSTLILKNLHSLELARATAEEAVREKEEFLENISHEIRNPLQSISGLCELLEKNNPSSHQLQLIKSLKFNSANLQSLVNDVLDYKKLLLGEVVFFDEWVSVEQLFEALYGSNNYVAITRKLKFIIEIDSFTKSIELYVDKLRLSQVINNLLVNAMKFTNTGGQVVLRSEKIKETIEKVVVRFSIIDTGKGIKPEMLEDIRKRYFTNSDKHAFADSFGLGLSIVIQLLERMGAKLQIKSEEGVGSTFFFDIETGYRQLPGVLPDTKKDITISGLSAMSLLVIDDDQQILSLYKHLFEGKVIKLVEARKLEEIPEKGSQSFDIVVADLRLGGESLKNGFDKIKDVLSDEALVYIVSARIPGSEVLPDTFSISAWMQKPVEINRFLKQIQQDVLGLRYGRPNTLSIKKDYDFDREKYKRALGLLISEWTGISKDLYQAIRLKDEAVCLNLIHKIITSVRRLELDKFEKMLTKIQDACPEGDVAYYEVIIPEAMTFYIDFLQTELNELPDF